MTNSESDNRSEMVQLLRSIVSSTFVVYMKTYAVHWNYHGHKFFSVHKLTEGQYEDQAEAIDLIAERVRALGGEAPISLACILEDTAIKEFTTVDRKQDELVSNLVVSNQKLAELCRSAAVKLDELCDRYSHDIVVARIGAHEKAAWMLHSQLE